MSDVVLYTQPSCGPCSAVKGRLKTYGIDYSEVDIQSDLDAADELISVGARQTPVLKHGGTYYKTPTEILAFVKSMKEEK